jgi:CBS domain containing-hemolysin-like protein
MISEVLQLAERPIRSVMTPRAEVDHVDLAATQAEIHTRLMHSSYSRLPLIRDGRIDEPLGFVHKKELYKELLTGNQPNLETMVRKRSTCWKASPSLTRWSRCVRNRRISPSS